MAEEERKKKKKEKVTGAPEYMVTYGDLMTLLLTFFIILLTPARIDGVELRLILASFPGLGNLLGGQSFTEGTLPHLGQIIEALPSDQRGRALDRLRKDAVQIFESEITNDKVQVTITERGLIISLTADTYFEKYSARLNLEANLDSLRNLSSLLRTFFTENPDTPFDIEGHTDEEQLPTGSPYTDEWGLSTARSLSMLRFLEQFLVPMENGQVSGFGNTRTIVEDGDDGSPFNRRVDIIILNEGNL